MAVRRLADLDRAGVVADLHVDGVEVGRHRVELGADPLAIVECPPPWRQGIGQEWTRFPIARLRYTQATRIWTLYWHDRNLRFHLYDQIEPSPDIGDLLLEVDRDPTAIFWG